MSSNCWWVNPQKFFVGKDLNPAYVRKESSISKELRKINRYKDDPEDILTMEMYLEIAGLHEVTAREAFTMYESSTVLYDNVALALIYAANLEVPACAGDTNDAVRLCERAIEALGFRKAKFVTTL